MNKTENQSPAPKRGRPRDVEVEEKIWTATMELLSKNSYANVSIQAIATHSGVSKPAIYRRYKNKSELIVAALINEFQSANPTIEQTGDVRQDLVHFMENLIHLLNETVVGKVMRVVVPELPLHPQLERLFLDTYQRRAQFLQGVFMKAYQEAVLPADFDAKYVTEALLGPVYFRFFISREELSQRYVRELVDKVLKNNSVL